MSLKRCPFCKKEIDIFDTSCPNCGRVLIETIENYGSTRSTPQQDRPHTTEKPKEILTNIRGRLKKLINIIKDKFEPKGKIYTYQFDKWKRYKRIIFILVGIVIIILIVNIGDDSEPSKNNLIISRSTTVQTETTEPNIKSPREYVSLINGTIIDSIPLYLKGMGELNIDNGTNMDALAKLVRSYPHKSVYTVYIKAKSIYRMNGISDGYYDIYFAHGQDWDKSNQKFLVNASYSKFEDGFDFVTKDEYLLDGINTIYTVFEVTLHSVFGGSAETHGVSEDAFSQF